MPTALPWCISSVRDPNGVLVELAFPLDPSENLAGREQPAQAGNVVKPPRCD